MREPKHYSEETRKLLKKMPEPPKPRMIKEGDWKASYKNLHGKEFSWFGWLKDLFKID